MTPTFDSILNCALQLPPEQRSRMASRLMRSVEEEDPMSQEWLEELDRRIARADSGEASAIPHEQVMAEVRSLIAAITKRAA